MTYLLINSRYLAIRLPGVELTISRSQVRRPNLYIMEPPWASLDLETCLQALWRLFLFLLLLVLRFFISQPIVVKLRIQISDNIIHNRTVSDFQLKS